ncbi:helical backbone metal receptor [Aeromicrobium duanguangcaii]|uniref:Helical backbone metal receptor n=1 Tax=Aeromicrobium duanguangcaii TaxID=2968086 RepID=A0ABY5KGQ6_9ACTN|nr:helical backbone metal receptor [Aeromicrobium duanguangcaii]MCD9155116.1 helical backbone metal receptor [Aeromicrobium duanguangcaii]UUI68230.1 helical backbone metal receptor [Aeromicrobium duanguangcaii]
MHDDLGFHVALSQPVRRVVSLVPSLTGAIAATRPGSLVGATDWCTHPAGLEVARVRGTKNPDRSAILALSPDVVIANKEENRELDVRRLREAGVPVWVTDIETLDRAFSSMRRLFDEALGWGVPAWLVEAERRWAEPVRESGRRVAVAIWRDPWMVVGRDTFTGDLLGRLGVVHAFADASDRYPHIDLADLDAGDLDLVLLPDEPYVFTAGDGPEAFARVPTALCSGRALTWYGPSLLTARDDLAAALA